jgi:hypothetical protein
MGRPPVPSHLKRDKRLVVMMTDVESARLAEAARAADALSISDWVRESLLDAASGEADAYRHWLGFMMLHVASGESCTPVHMQDHLRALREAGDLQRVPAIEEVATAIMERFSRYSDTKNLNDLWIKL